MIVSSYLNESWHNIIYTMTTSFYRFRLVVYIGRKGILCYLQWFYKILCNALSLLRIIISVLNAAFGKLLISFSLSLSSIYFLGTFKSIVTLPSMDLLYNIVDWFAVLLTFAFGFGALSGVLLFLVTSAPSVFLSHLHPIVFAYWSFLLNSFKFFKLSMS